MTLDKVITYLAVVIVLLGLAPLVLAQQQEEQAPLSLMGDLGVGYGGDQSSGVSNSGPVVDADFDLGGYLRDPRILLFHVDPFVSLGNSVGKWPRFVQSREGVQLQHDLPRREFRSADRQLFSSVAGHSRLFKQRQRFGQPLHFFFL